MGEPHLSADADALLPEDRATLAAIRRGNDWLRALLCTLARRGVAFRLAFPERTQALLATLSRFPLYKGGQFLFDLMEWEDFMIDGPPPPLLTTALDARVLGRMGRWLQELQSRLDGGIAPLDPDALRAEVEGALFDDADLPSLEAGFYLYPDVVLGLLVNAGPLLSQVAAVAQVNDPLGRGPRGVPE